MTITELLRRIHLRYAKDTSYPSSGEEDYEVRLAYVDDGISEWEKKGKEGAILKPLLKTLAQAAVGTGTDPLPADFLSLIRENGKPAYLSDGSRLYREVSPTAGQNMLLDNQTNGDVFWIEAGNIRTLPAITGTISMNYLRKATRYPTGTETTELEIEEPAFLQEYTLAQLYLEDGDLNKYSARSNTALEILDGLAVEGWITPVDDSSWGFGM